MATVSVEGHGSIVLVRPLDEEALEWLIENVSDQAYWFGGALAVEPRYVDDLLAGMAGEGDYDGTDP